MDDIELHCEECRRTIQIDWQADIDAYSESGMCAKCWKKEQQHAGHEWQAVATPTVLEDIYIL